MSTEASTANIDSLPSVREISMPKLNLNLNGSLDTERILPGGSSIEVHRNNQHQTLDGNKVSARYESTQRLTHSKSKISDN